MRLLEESELIFGRMMPVVEPHLIERVALDFQRAAGQRANQYRQQFSVAQCSDAMGNEFLPRTIIRGQSGYAHRSPP